MRKFIFAALGVTMISAAAQASFVYAVDIRNDRFVRFDTMSPGSQTVLATGVTANYFGMDFNSTASTLYAAASPAAGTAQLHTLNLANGAVTSNIGITGIDSDANVTGLTIGASNQAFLSANGTSGGNKLYSLNLMTGAASFIGNMGVGGTNLIIDIAINSAGQMVAHDIATDSFSFVNTSTGALTPIGPHGLAANFAQGMDFDHSNNTLYAAVYTGGGTNTYGSVNLTTGQVTSIPGITSGEYEMAIASPVPEPASLLALGLGGIAVLRRRRANKA